MSTKIRNKVQCNCKVCDGKYVKERTRKRHIELELERRLASSIFGFVPFLPGNNRDEPAHTALEIGNSLIAEGSSSSKKRLNKKSQLHLTVIVNQILPFLSPKKGEDKTSSENWKSISMKIQVKMKAINRLTNMNVIATYLQKTIIWF